MSKPAPLLFKHWLSVIGIGLGISLLFLFAMWRAQRRPGSTIHISVHPPTLHFIDPDKIRQSLMERHEGLPSERINLQRIEDYLGRFAFIARVEARRHPIGDIYVDIWQKKPIARLVKFGHGDEYITNKGERIPVGSAYAPRVMTLQLPPKQSHQTQNALIEAHLNLLNHIAQNPFWCAQIAAVVIESKQTCTLYPQVTHQRIRMRTNQHDYEKKLNELYTFYIQGLSKKGWTHYREIDLRFDNQIVCR